MTFLILKRKVFKIYLIFLLLSAYAWFEFFKPEFLVYLLFLPPNFLALYLSSLRRIKSGFCLERKALKLVIKTIKRHVNDTSIIYDLNLQSLNADIVLLANGKILVIEVKPSEKFISLKKKNFITYKFKRYFQSKGLSFASIPVKLLFLDMEKIDIRSVYKEIAVELYSKPEVAPKLVELIGKH